MRSFFDENFRYTSIAQDVESPLRKPAQEIFDFWVKLRYSPREISYLLQRLIIDIELETILLKDYNDKKSGTQET